jgi:hypothetical protein
VASSNVTGTAGNDSWTVVNPGTFTLNGLEGTDTLNLGTSERSSYIITRHADGVVHVDSVSGASAALHATLLNMERLTFNSGRDVLDLTTYFGDVTAPTLVSASPSDDSTGVAVGSNIVLSFSETVQRGSGSIVIKDAAGSVLASYDAATSSQLVFSGSTLTIDPASDFAYGSSLAVDILAGAVKDTAGNAYAGLSGYTFTTEAGPGSTLIGTAGNDHFTPSADTTAIRGDAGIDTVVLNKASSAYQLQATATGFSLAGNGAAPLTLEQVERLQFTDHSLALDLDGHAGQVARILGAVFGADAVHNTIYAGIGLQYSDGGMDYADLMQLALDARLGAGASHADVVTLLYTNVVGVAPSAPDLAGYVALLDDHSYTPGSLGVMAADTALNTTQIDLVGLAASGLVFTP